MTHSREVIITKYKFDFHNYKSPHIIYWLQLPKLLVNLIKPSLSYSINKETVYELMYVS